MVSRDRPVNATSSPLAAHALAGLRSEDTSTKLTSKVSSPRAGLHLGAHHKVSDGAGSTYP